MAKVLMVLTSHDRLGDTGHPTGFWLEEFAAPYYVLKDAGVDITIASPKGGQPPVDPKSNDPKDQTPAMQRFRQDPEAQRALANTVRLASVSADDFDAVFYPGGHGPLWDLAEDRDSIALIDRLYAAGKPVAAVCHGPAVLRRAKAPDGTPLVKGKSVTGFANSEEAAAGLTSVVPFLVEDALKANGGKYSKAADWADHAVVDGNLITGQNPASSESTARALLRQLEVGVGATAGAGAQSTAPARPLVHPASLPGQVMGRGNRRGVRGSRSRGRDHLSPAGCRRGGAARMRLLPEGCDVPRYLDDGGSTADERPAGPWAKARGGQRHG